MRLIELIVFRRDDKYGIDFSSLQQLLPKLIIGLQILYMYTYTDNPA